MAVTKRKNKWQVRVRDYKGSFYPAKSFARKVDADSYERKLLLKKESGESSNQKYFRYLTVIEYFRLWNSECRSHVSKGWLSTQLQLFNTHIGPIIGKSIFIKLSTREVVKVLNIATDNKLSSQSRLHIYNLLHVMFEDAQNHFELNLRNPVIKKYKPKVHKKERSFWSAKQSKCVLSYVREQSHWLCTTLWVALLTGMRPSEIQALKWTQVDFENSRIVINSAYNRKEKIIQPYPKQRDWGAIPLPPDLKNYLLELKKGKFDLDFVCPGRDGKMLLYSAFKNGLTRLCSELEILRLTPHELRHSATDLFYQAGASAEDLRRLLNHSSLGSTKTYIHKTEQRLQEIVSNVSV